MAAGLGRGSTTRVVAAAVVGSLVLLGAEVGAFLGARTVLDHRAYVSDLRLDAALETEAGTGPVGAWEREVAGLEQLVLRAAGPEFAAARAEGSLLSIAEAAGLDAGDPR